MPAKTAATVLHGDVSAAFAPRIADAPILPVTIDALAGPRGTVDIRFEWMHGAASTIRIPAASAVALGSDLLGIATAAPPLPAATTGPAHPHPLPRARRAGLSTWLLLAVLTLAGLWVGATGMGPTADG